MAGFSPIEPHNCTKTRLATINAKLVNTMETFCYNSELSWYFLSIQWISDQSLFFKYFKTTPVYSQW